MKKAIEILVLRVSSNGKYIEFIINCPKDYFFTDFTIQVYGAKDIYSLKSCLFEAPIGHLGDDVIEGADGKIYWNKLYYSGQFKVEDLDVHVPEMYEIHLTAEHNPACPDDTEQFPEGHGSDRIEEEIHSEAFISDVSKAYTCLMNDILSSGESLCGDSEVMDKVIRNYLVLYAHQEAIHMHELKEARKYFTLLNNCFNTCGGKMMTGTCNLCNGGTLSESRRFDTYKPSNCGCGR